MVSPEVVTEVGQRVAVGEHIGTVRYVGSIPDAKGTWLGIEWDDPKRGKHNGTYNGQKYFKTRHPTSGSFIHIEKADFGRSCVSAIKERYGSNQLTLTAEELKDLQRAMNAPHLEMVGFDKVNEKQSCFSDLEVISLHNLQVSTAGDELASMCLKAKDVDLSLNLLPSWDEVAKITIKMPQIKFLNLSFNRLELPKDPESLCDAFRMLSHLVLSHMDYTWEQILTCSKMCPQIQQLQVPFNNITNINLPADTLINLTHLDLEGNPIPDWEEVNKLGTLEKLESLNVCNLNLTSVFLPLSQNLFKNLECLLLSDNKLDKWDYISHLNRLPKLKELRFTNNPILENLSIETAYYNIIARIGSLEILNREIVTKQQRRGAELEYLKEFGKAWKLSSKNEDLRSFFLLNHPRYEDLIDKHGEPEVAELDIPINNCPLVQVQLWCSSKRITKKLSKTMTILTLGTVVRRLFKTGPKNHTLVYCSSRNPDIKCVMDSLYQNLDYYCVEDDDEIHVTFN